MPHVLPRPDDSSLYEVCVMLSRFCPSRFRPSRFHLYTENYRFFVSSAFFVRVQWCSAVIYGFLTVENFGPELPEYCLKCVKCGRLILRKIIEIVSSKNLEQFAIREVTSSKCLRSFKTKLKTHNVFRLFPVDDCEVTEC